MPAVTIGLDFGTTSIKCVARPYGSRNLDAAVIRSPRGAWRWPSLVGRIEVGPDAGKLLLLDECLGRSPGTAMFERNLKLALLCPEDSWAGTSIADRWNCLTCRALPVLLLGAAIRHALEETTAVGLVGTVNIVIPAPVGPDHPPDQIRQFERAAFAALELARKWSKSVPNAADVAIRDAASAWNDSGSLPDRSKRLSAAVPEGYAALMGVRSTLGRIALPRGRIALMDIGGGTTDLAVAIADRDDGLTALGVSSIDVAGDRFDSVLAGTAVEQAGRSVSREEIWNALRAASDRLEGDDWSLTLAQAHTALDPHLAELNRLTLRWLAQIHEEHGQSRSLHLVLTGGVTMNRVLANPLLKGLRNSETSIQELPVGDWGVREDIGNTPLAVALGLSLGIARLEGWRELKSFTSVEPVRTTLSECRCRGLLFNCRSCGGSGFLGDGPGVPRFAFRTDSLKETERLRRCLRCHTLVPTEELRVHIEHAHPPDPLPSSTKARSPRPIPAVEAATIRALVQTPNDITHSTDEIRLAEHIRTLWTRCVRHDPDPLPFERFLQKSSPFVERCPWLCLPRSICFAMLCFASDVETSLSHAREAGQVVPRSFATTLRSLSPDRFIKAWEMIL